MSKNATSACSLIAAMGLAAGCAGPSDPKPMLGGSSANLSTAECQDSWATVTEAMCRKAVLEKCKAGAEVVSVVKHTEFVFYRNMSGAGGTWLPETTRIVTLKNC